MMVLDISMKQRIRPNNKSQNDHAPLKNRIVNDVDAKYRQGGNQHRQQCTMYGTDYRSSDAHHIPIDFCIHGQKCKGSKFAITLQLLIILHLAKSLIYQLVCV